MSKLKCTSDIWEISPTLESKRTAANYASRTLPWTFNRMMANTSALGQCGRGLNIAKGIAVQEALAKYMRTQGHDIELERKSHRADDLFDFRTKIGEKEHLIDVKSIAYYNDYPGDIRAPFNNELIIEYADYGGPDWRIFFPMLVPHTQINQDKHGYIFVITKSGDFRRDILGDRVEDFIIAYPYGPYLPFLTARQLCIRREEENKGIYLVFELQDDYLFDNVIQADVLFEWNGQCQSSSIQLNTGCDQVEIGPMSVFNGIRLSRKDFAALNVDIHCRVSRNELVGEIFNASRSANLNTSPDTTMSINKDCFCNLMLPNDYTAVVLGWITKEEFITRCKSYSAWIWPKDSIDRNRNQVWSQVTAKDQKMLDRIGLIDTYDREAGIINAGILKTTGRGSGANCYVFPNVYRTGVKETNLYVLPQDLNTMNSFIGLE